MGASIAVALCTHNGARFVEEQLRSILDQTRPPQQIVISDDASTDDTMSIATALLARHEESSGHPPLEVIILRNPDALGVALNFEAAMLATSADLVALSDRTISGDRIDSLEPRVNSSRDLTSTSSSATRDSWMLPEPASIVPCLRFSRSLTPTSSCSTRAQGSRSSSNVISRQEPR